MKRLLSLLLLLLPFMLEAQDDASEYVLVSEIIIEGNDVTKDAVILRELTFVVGDTISLQHFDEVLKVSKENVLNTTLFNFVSI